jgi:MSHA biogenesis protein MshJ
MKNLQALAERIDSLSLRERGFVMGGVAAVLYFLWNAVLMQPLEVRHKAAQVAMLQKSAELEGLNAEAQQLVRDLQADPDVANREKLDQLKAELAQMSTELKDTTDHLMAPAEMAVTLEQVLRRTQGLKLQSVSSLGASPVFAKDAKAAAKAKAPAGANQPAAAPPAMADAGAATAAEQTETTLYKHGLQIVFDGDFFKTLEYLKAIEALDARFFWDSFTLDVVEYPESRTTLSVYTISMGTAWIGA